MCAKMVIIVLFKFTSAYKLISLQGKNLFPKYRPLEVGSTDTDTVYYGAQGQVYSTYSGSIPFA